MERGIAEDKGAHVYIGSGYQQIVHEPLMTTSHSLVQHSTLLYRI